MTTSNENRQKLYREHDKQLAEDINREYGEVAGPLLHGLAKLVGIVLLFPLLLVGVLIATLLDMRRSDSN